ncbi:MAG: NAD-dependent epimerase/dehydratase family protein [Pelagibacteraceae bacterium TMED124]|nr:MAG: NAD-dependent epimerase/dehydratase family protein [Pelagibacteraceae bacterium TMED124]
MLDENTSVLVTGAAGFIGAAISEKLLSRGIAVAGIDNYSSYYDIQLKKKRVENIKKCTREKFLWKFFKGSIEDDIFLEKVFKEIKPKIVINLAAQAGVRYSLINPKSYILNNLLGFANVLEVCKKYKISNLIYASSSSVYGNNKNVAFSENDKNDKPVSLYAATKISNELMAYSYAHLYNLPCIGLRFFTVYGPWGRPDMAPMIFAKSILEEKPIQIFNYGEMKRDFTYIDDIVEGIFRCCEKPFVLKNFSNKYLINSDKFNAPHKIFNIGNGSPVKLMDFIGTLEQALGKTAIKEYKSLQPGDVLETYADTSYLKEWIDFCPNTPLKEGINKFANWFINYYK